MTPSRDDAPVEPLCDSWRGWSHAASWMWTPRSRPASNAAASRNPWAAGQLTELLEVLRPIARLRGLVAITPPEVAPLSDADLRWSADQPHAAFEAEAIAWLRDAAAPISTVELAFDLLAWVRIAPAPAVPIHAWLERALWGELACEVEAPYGALSVHHTLFFDGALHGEPNGELHRLNAPRLHDALAAIERSLGPITEASGLPGVIRTGVTSEA